MVLKLSSIKIMFGILARQTKMAATARLSLVRDPTRKFVGMLFQNNRINVPLFCAIHIYFPPYSQLMYNWCIKIQKGQVEIAKLEKVLSLVQLQKKYS